MPEKTNEIILAIARDILTTEGPSGLSFDAIARRLGKSKQAVLYWFPTKQDLVVELFLPWLESEADAAAKAVDGAGTRVEAVGHFVRAVAGFHLRDLDRFRMMYLVLQTTPRTSTEPGNAAIMARVHPVTDRMYAALASRITSGRVNPTEARREAAAIHSAVVGMVLMVALSEAIGDPLKHSSDDLTEALVASLTRAAPRP